MKTFVITCRKTVTYTQHVRVLAETADEAIEYVRNGNEPVQWPDGNYLSRGERGVEIIATEA